MINPQFKVTIGTNVFENRGMLSASIQLLENAYDTANLIFSNEPVALYPGAFSRGDAVTVEVKDACYSAYTKIFGGTLLFPDYTIGKPKNLLLSCVGKGYALNMMNVAEEYGTQSRNPSVNAIAGVITDATVGVIPKYVEHYMATANDSGYTIDTANVEAITGAIPYIVSPYKPADKFLNDLCDLVTALKAGSAGPHWRVDSDGNLRMKLIGANQTGWTKYINGATNTDGSSTLTEGIDFINGDFQPMGKQANVVVIYGTWRRPSSGDSWTNPVGDAALRADWDCDATTTELDADATNIIIGDKSVQSHGLVGAGYLTSWYPHDKNAAWDFSSFTDFNTPSLNFYYLRGAGAGSYAMTVRLCEDDTKYFEYSFSVSDVGKWMHYSLPIGPYYNKSGSSSETWTATSPAANWNNINFIVWHLDPAAASDYFCIDGLHFGDAAVCRVARDKWPGAEGGTLGQTGNEVRMKVFTDHIGKDDSLQDGDDSGAIAKNCYAEWLRLSKETNVGRFTTGMLPQALPGQYVTIEAADWRIVKLTQNIYAQEKIYSSAFEVTDDVTNSNSRARYDDQNKIREATRPEWQDRQATSQKAGELDIRIARLEKYY